MSANPKGIIRLPQVEQILQRPFLALFIQQLSRPLITDIVRESLTYVRRSPLFRDDSLTPEAHKEKLLKLLDDTISNRCRFVFRQRHHRVINATGTVVHTNLGRSPIEREVWDSVTDLCTGYCNLEIKLSDGKRGERKGIAGRLFGRLIGCDDALVVNNNAASVHMILNELGQGKEVIVSRGEQIQIGGGFRIPDIMAMSGAKLVEVGTTNITTADDYLNAITDNTSMVLMVHTSNFAIRGFTKRADIRTIKKGLPEHVVLAVDQGSGLTTEGFAPDETPASHYIKAGADIVCFSGDKILGGPQAGIICGRQDLVKKLEKNPMMRAFRPSKIIYSLLEELLVRKLNRNDKGQGIAERSVNSQQLRKLATDFAESIDDERLQVVQDQMIVGGGTLPDTYFPSWALCLNLPESPDKLLAELRNAPVPVIGVIRNDKVHLNMAAILPADRGNLESTLRAMFLKRP
ncbi:L-seryl-tRNA(Sec) selenium transferase [invertebrate metagenome]|uniref:L-seryl-tRNA(Sec) selenium transferase n=1 Tax=invertebrate metagenome TaxID=1711999 RepID=A0A2H9T834_9ZZZZ